jgi:ABC-2 type transport system ATP-binding protein
MEADEARSIRIDGLRREFGGIIALDGVTLDIEEPQIVGVAGPNGSGKTTLIRTLLGTLRPTSGSVEVNGIDPLSFTGADRARLGYMPQNEAVYPDLMVRENVTFFARLYGVENVADAVDRVLGFVDLSGRRNSLVGDLSGGMVQRTNLACAVVHRPNLLFLDEPTVGLDPQLRASMWEGFRERRDRGTFIVVSTHYLGEARHCDRVLFLRDGRVLAFDAPESFLEATGTETLDDAFLALLDRNAANESVGEDQESAGEEVAS